MGRFFLCMLISFSVDAEPSLIQPLTQGETTFPFRTMISATGMSLS